MLPRTQITPDHAIPPIINGCWQLSRGHRVEQRGVERVVAELMCLVESGLTAFDCGDIYLGVEEFLGALIQRTGAAAARIQVHTKYVPDLADLPTLKRRDVERVVDRSLRRLGVERLDLVQFHWWDYGVPRYVETASWLDELRRAGKIRLLGVTNFDVPRLRELVDAGLPISTQQVQYSLLDRRPERGMVDLCRDHGIHLLAYGVLAGGFLTDRWRDAAAPAEPLATRSLVKYRLVIDECGGWASLQSLLKTLAAVASRHGVTVASVATRFVLDRPQVGAVIVGARGADHVTSTRDTLALDLDDEDRRLIGDALGSFASPGGDVYSLERDRTGLHGAIMKYDLHEAE